jgi:hypothetical protein
MDGSTTNNVTVHRFRVQRSGLRTKKDIKDPKSSLKMLISPNNCQFGFKFWIRPDETDAFLVNTYHKFSPGTRMQPLAQTWHVKMLWWKAKPIECESNFIATSHRTLRGVGSCPYEPEARAGLNP